MILRGRTSLLSAKIYHGATRIPFASVTSHGRAAAYRRLYSHTCASNWEVDHSSFTSTTRSLSWQWQHVRSTLNKSQINHLQPLLSLRLLHSSRLLRQQNSQHANARETSSQATNKEDESASTTSNTQTDAHEKASDETHSSSSKSESKDEDKKQEAPPPPPHGDKSAWQVFTETLRSEFKASKEWNESTKALASSAHQFSESDSVKRARAAYTAASGAATSRTSEALKSTGKAIGHSAAWTWETPVVKGLRGGVNATGRGIERATRPVRDTKAFQSLKETVDDGSSSRYGGWLEKEERRKQKELRELKQSHQGGARIEKMEEDPK